MRNSCITVDSLRKKRGRFCARKRRNSTKNTGPQFGPYRMSKPSYPTADELQTWVSSLQEDTQFGKYYPIIGDDWLDRICGCFSVIKLNPANRRIFRAGADLFYKIIKNHYFIDGNKRSSVLATYVFFLLNGWHINCSADHLIEIARKTAKSKPATQRVRIRGLTHFFQKHCIRKVS